MSRHSPDREAQVHSRGGSEEAGFKVGGGGEGGDGGRAGLRTEVGDAGRHHLRRRRYVYVRNDPDSFNIVPRATNIDIQRTWRLVL